MIQQKSRKALFLLLLFVAPSFFGGCGPSDRERRQQAIEDSLKLDQERRQLLERTGEMIDSAEVQLPDSL